jgi:hypothetical protein
VLHGLIWPAFLAEVVVMLPDVRSKRQWLRAHTIKAAIVVVTRRESRVASLVSSVPGWRPQTVSIGYGAPRSNSPSPRAECPGTESLIGSAIIGIATVMSPPRRSLSSAYSPALRDRVGDFSYPWVGGFSDVAGGGEHHEDVRRSRG